jgi:N-acetylglucosaminyl-diphospho-decaprenol L-rhamnosyltransferase
MSNRGLPQDANFHPDLDAAQSHDAIALIAPSSRRRSAAARRAAYRRQFLANGPIDVSVCIANWNCLDLLRGCLESLQDRPQGVRLEVIVVDNASVDGAADMVAREFPEVLLIRNAANRGFSRANNQAADKARGRFLFFLNNDTIVPPGTLRRLVDFAERHPEVGMVGPRLRDGQGHFQVSYRQRPTLAALLHRTVLLRWTRLFKRAYRRYRRQDFDPYTVRNVDILMGAAVMLPRERFFACGRWDEDFAFGGEDLDLSTRVNRAAKVVYLPQAEILHLGRVSSRLHIGFASAQMAIGLIRYLRKSGCGRLPLMGYKLAVTLDTPLQLVSKILQSGWRRMLRQHDEAEKSWLAARGCWHLMTLGLFSFWGA